MSFEHILSQAPVAVNRTYERSYNLVYSAISVRNTRNSTFSVSVHANVTTIQKQHTITRYRPNPDCLTRRGVIRGFSHKSRNRLIQALAKLRVRHKLLFVTLTLSDDAVDSLVARQLRIQDILAHLRYRIARRDDSVGAVWRVEWVTRKSGRYEGKIVPHLHLIVDTSIVPGDFFAFLKKAWGEVCKSDCRIDVTLADSRKKITRYVSKYVAKVSDECDSEFTGRHWGYFGNLDFSASQVVELSLEQVVQLKRLIRSWLKSLKTKSARSYAHRLAKLDERLGCFVLGLGDECLGCGESTISRMLNCVCSTYS